MKIAEAFVELQLKLNPSEVSRAKGQVKSAAAKMERDGKIRLDTDNKPLAAGLKDAERSVSTTARAMTQTFLRLFTAREAIRQFADMISSASDLNESINAVNVTFGEAAEGVQALGEESATALGLSTSAFNGLAVRFSSFAQTIAGPGGDVAATLDEMTTRAADFASVMNIDVKDAAELFQSGLAGESEPLRQYGIDLSDAAVQAHALAVGIGDGTGVLSEAEKVQARYSLLLESTSQVQGDFANTSEGAANQQRILAAEFENAKAKLGSALLPIYGKVVGVLTKLVELFSSLPAPVQAGVVAMLGVVAVAGPVRDATKAFEGLTGVVGKLGKLGGAAGPIAGVIAAIGIAAVVIHEFGRKQRESEARIDAASGAFEDATLAALDYGDAARATGDDLTSLELAQRALSLALTADDPEFTNALGAVGIQATDALGILLQLGDAGGDAIGSLGAGADLTAEQIGALTPILTGLFEGAGFSREQSRAFVDAFYIGDEDFATAWEILADRLGITKDEALALMEQVEPTTDAIGALIERAGDTDKLDDMARTLLNDAVQASKYGEELVALAEAQSGASRNGEDAGLVYQELLGILEDMTPAEREAAIAALGLGDSVAASGTAAGTGSRRWLGALRALTSASDDWVANQRRLTETLGLSGPQAAAFFLAIATGVTDQQKLADIAGVTVDELVHAMSGIPSAVDPAASALHDLDGELIRTADAMEHDVGPSIEGIDHRLRDLDAATSMIPPHLVDLNKGLSETSTALGELRYQDPFQYWNEAAKNSEGLGAALAGAVDDTTEAFDDAGDAAGDAAARVTDLESAVNSLFEAFAATTPAEDLREATRRIEQELDGLSEGLVQARKDGLSLWDAFDSGTEAGRDNQRMLEENGDAIYAHGALLMQQGASAEEAAGDIATHTETLRQNMIAAGYDEEEVDALIATYLRTPAEVATELALIGTAQAALAIAQHKTNLEGIPHRRDTTVAVEATGVEFAEERLAFLARNRTANITSIVSQIAAHRALGGYGDRPEVAVWGEAGPEAILPLSRPGRIRQLMADPRIGEPIAAAMGADAGGMTTVDSGVHIHGDVNVGSRQDVPRVVDALDEVLFLARMR